MVTDLQALASTAQGFFPDHQQPLHSNMPMNYPQHQAPNGQSYYAPTSQSSYAYGNVSYALNHGGEIGQASIESQKQGLESIRSLVMDAKAGAFDTGAYGQFGTRLAAIANSNLPFLSGASMADFPVQSGGGSPSGGVYAPTAQYALPSLPNLRTKSDLLDADQIFQAMQTTIYENPQAVAAAGAGQPGAHYVQSMGPRHSNSPPGLQLQSAHNTNYTSKVETASPQSSHSGSTPAMTPPSSAHSYASGNSPHSFHGNNGFQQQAPPAAMYPTLPAASLEPANGYGTAHMAPTSTLENQLDNSHRRRYSGGRLQKARPVDVTPKREDVMDTAEDGEITPKNSVASSSSSEAAPVANRPTRGKFSSSNLDPALGGVVSPGEMDETAVKDNEMWVRNARTIEALRACIQKRIEANEYENKEEEQAPEAKKEPASLYPVLAEA